MHTYSKLNTTEMWEGKKAQPPATQACYQLSRTPRVLSPPARKHLCGLLYTIFFLSRITNSKDFSLTITFWSNYSKTIWHLRVSVRACFLFAESVALMNLIMLCVSAAVIYLWCFRSCFCLRQRPLFFRRTCPHPCPPWKSSSPSKSSTWSRQTRCVVPTGRHQCRHSEQSWSALCHWLLTFPSHWF